jgi:phosphoglycolate phosphatase-like HAD superfamily hydrolase
MKKKYIIFDFDWTLVDSNSKEFFNWVIEMIKNLSKKYTLFISSQTDDKILKEKIKNAWLFNNFEVIFWWWVLEKWPKHIEVFDMLTQDQDFENRTVYIWDSELDREIAKEAWISFVKIWKEWLDYYEIEKTTDLEEYLKKVK